MFVEEGPHPRKTMDHDNIVGSYSMCVLPRCVGAAVGVAVAVAVQGHLSYCSCC